MSDRNNLTSVLLRGKTYILYFIFILFIALITFFISLQLGKKTPTLSLEQIITKCASKTQSTLTDSKEYCYSAEFKNISAKYGSQFAFAKLEELKKLDPSALGCHWIAHGIGMGTYIKNSQNWRQELSSISQTCNYGAQHGIVESYISTLPEGKITDQNILTICGDKPINDCNHVVGHIVLVTYSGDIDQSLEICQMFKDSLQNHYCNQGVFMENITALNLIDHKIVSEDYLNWSSRFDQIKQMCKKYSDPPAMACWEESTHAAVQKYQNEFSKVLEWCDEAPSVEGRDKCKIHAIGIITATNNYQLANISRLCRIPQKSDPDFESNCYSNIVGSMLSTVPEKLNDAVDFCASLANSDFVSNCISMIYTVSNSELFSRSDIQNICNTKPDQIKNICLNSVNSKEINIHKN